MTWREWTHSAKLAWGNDDAAFMQHTGVELEHVVDVHGHKVLCQVPLEVDRNRRIYRYITNTVSMLQTVRGPWREKRALRRTEVLGLPLLHMFFCSKNKLSANRDLTYVWKVDKVSINVASVLFSSGLACHKDLGWSTWGTIWIQNQHVFSLNLLIPMASTELQL